MSLHERPIGTAVGISSDGISRFDGHGNTATVLTLTGDIDESSILSLRARLREAVMSSSLRIVIDVAEVEFLSVQAAVELADAHRLADVRKVEVIMVAGPRCVERALLATRLQDVFATAPSLRSALAGGELGLGFSAAAV
ncbi:STAS domain-containing protein [Antrihabitans cavernicola]|uniref:STAS domain-containing protein n=1 Tax=Antrihabitans cavernicola TaxID=2495913 RepID=A0A5A7S4F7_9NOCA|nr:STAS domain-containing protein [Spelaeibacter cavernicola]KAA0019463.1 STAS domain-containing protein [Spelaeibacter cavernicola]